MKAAVAVMLKPGMPDPQGNAICLHRDLGKVDEVCQEAARRLGILSETGTRDLAGPETMP